jgi:hypothetical protein
MCYLTVYVVAPKKTYDTEDRFFMLHQNILQACPAHAPANLTVINEKYQNGFPR